MKIKVIIICLLLISSLAWADNNIVVHINYPADTAYIGATNIFEVWLESDVEINAFILSFEFSSYAGEVNWDTAYGKFPPIEMEKDLLQYWTLGVFPEGYGFDNSYLPDSLGVAVISLGTPMPPSGGLRKCFRAHFSIPSGESTGEICIDNITMPLNWLWVYNPSGTPEIAPDYFGCVNAGTQDPDCPAVCFPVAVRSDLCGDADDNGIITLGDPIFLVNYIFAFGPAPLSMITSDAFCNGRINMADVAVIIEYLFGGGPSPCYNCP